MTIDDKELHELIVESQDLQSDALRDTKSMNRDLVEIRHERLATGIDPDENLHHVDRYNSERRRVLRNGGMGFGALAARGAIAATFGGALTALVAGPAAAAGDDVDVMILQTAASLENLAVATYEAALGLDFIKSGNKTVLAFAQMTQKQHADHGAAFNDSTKSLGGKEQKDPNAKYLEVVNKAKPNLKGPADVVKLAMALEQVATQTYNANTALMTDKDAKALMASVMGVESQHLAVLRAVDALLAGGGAALITVKETDGATDLTKLPKAAGSVAFEGPFEGTEKASPPEEGAVK